MVRFLCLFLLLVLFFPARLTLRLHPFPQIITFALYRKLVRLSLPSSFVFRACLQLPFDLTRPFSPPPLPRSPVFLMPIDTIATSSSSHRHTSHASRPHLAFLILEPEPSLVVRTRRRFLSFVTPIHDSTSQLSLASYTLYTDLTSLHVFAQLARLSSCSLLSQRTWGEVLA